MLVEVWGTVTAWNPPSTLAFTWHPGRDEDRASRVTVTFAAGGEQTLVRLEHAGWEVFANPRFGDHVAFLQRMMGSGYLVAAGSFEDAQGSGDDHSEVARGEQD